jgi:ribosomal-protein-alanine N-acetyltransferase
MIRRDGFDVFPRIESPRLELRRITQDDAGALFAIFSDEAVMRYWGAPPYASIDEARALIDRIEAAYRDENGIEWGIVEKGGGGQLIGKCCFHKLYKPHFRAEIGYALAPSRWGTGAMGEALRAMIAYGFEQMDLHSVEAQVDPENARSIAILERLGFRQEGHLRENFFSGGRFSDTLIFSLLKPTAGAPINPR